MMTRFLRTTWSTTLLLGAGLLAQAEEGIPPALQAYIRSEAQRLGATPLLGVTTAEDWKGRRPEFQRQMLEMLGLDPLPPRTDLKAEVRGVVERPDFVVERLVYQSSPGLYVTGNLYRPKVVEKPLPAILYVCGHARIEKDGVIYGNKAHYQHHAAWFAANGYVCLMIDTLQLGEVPGQHHGTYNQGRWWWQGRSYTPAGLEVWNGIRAVDYLLSRPEVDPDRIGLTGRSGGGAMSWFQGAVDDRIKAVVAVAGITDLHDHVVAGNPKVAHPGGVVDGHCDCMFFVNTYGWDYTMLAALVAPKPLLVENTDVDPIFPEAGVRRIYQHLETVYDWYGARDRLDLIVGKGGHEDTVELRHPAFAWFERWFKGDAATPLADIKEPSRAVPIEELKVLDPGKPLPANVNDTVDESFVPTPTPPRIPGDVGEWEARKAAWRQDLGGKGFDGPASADPQRMLVGSPESGSDRPPTEIVKHGLALTAYDLAPLDHPERTNRLWVFHDPGRALPKKAVELDVVGPEEWEALGPLVDAFEQADGDPTSVPLFEKAKAATEAGTWLAFTAPTGVGRTAFPKGRETSIRRRLALLGQTLDELRVLEVRHALRALAGRDDRPLTLTARGPMAAVALWATYFEGGPTRLVLINPPATVRDGPAFLNLERVLDMPQAVALLFPLDVEIVGSPADAWAWSRSLAERLGAREAWPKIRP